LFLRWKKGGARLVSASHRAGEQDGRHWTRRRRDSIVTNCSVKARSRVLTAITYGTQLFRSTKTTTTMLSTRGSLAAGCRARHRRASGIRAARD